MIYVVLRPLLGENGTARQRVGVSNPGLVTGHVGLARPDAVGVLGMGREHRPSTNAWF